MVIAIKSVTGDRTGPNQERLNTQNKMLFFGTVAVYDAFSILPYRYHSGEQYDLRTT